MQAYLDCYSCLLRQSLEAARYAKADSETQYRIIKKTLKILQDAKKESTPPEISLYWNQLVKNETGNLDPYKEKKVQSTQGALKHFSEFEKMLQESEDTFMTAVKLAIAGNIMDFGANANFDLMDSVKQGINKPLPVDATPELREKILKADWVLYLADNAGETVMDRFLIREIKKIKPIPVKYAVKSIPIINDALLEDALQAGIDQDAEIFETGCGTSGIDIGFVSEEFKTLFENAPLVIAKGQGNYEALSDNSKEIFFLLIAKCQVFSRIFNAPIGSFIVHRS